MFMESTAMAHPVNPTLEVYELGIPDQCIPISSYDDYDSEGPFNTYLSLPIAHLNQRELQRLYVAHPWVWFEPACCTADALRVVADWEYTVDDPDCDEYHYNFLEPDYIVVGAKGQLHWLRDHAYNQVHVPDNEAYFKGLEFIRVTVNKEHCRLIMENLFPFYKRETVGRRRKKRKSTVKIPGIKML